MAWADDVADLDATIDEHLRDPALLRRDGEVDRDVRVQLERPIELDRSDIVGLARPRPWVQISLLCAPTLAKGDLVLIGSAAPYDGWRIAGAPLRPGDGHDWRAEVEPLGPVS